MSSFRALSLTRRLIPVAALAGVTVLSAACSASPAPNPAGSVDSVPTASHLSGVTLRVGDQVHITESLLQASGQDRGLPYRVQFSEFTSGPPLLEALTAGAIDLGGVGDTPPIFSASAGGAIRVVAASSEGGDKADGIVVPHGSTLRTVADLRGKKVAVAEGSSANYTLLALLRRAGLTLSEVTPVYLQPAQALAALQAGDVDAWSIWYPFIAVAQANGARLLASGSDIPAGDGFEVSTPSTLSDAGKAAAIGDFVVRLARADRWVTTHRDQWVKLYSQLTGLSESVARRTLVIGQSQYVPIDETVISSEQSIADAFSAAGLIPHVDFARFVDTRYNARIQAAEVGGR